MKLRHVFGFQAGGGGKYDVITKSYQKFPGYDKIIELEVVEKGKHKGEVAISVGRDPRPGYDKTSSWSGHHRGKRRVTTGYISLAQLKTFVEENDK